MAKRASLLLVLTAAILGLIAGIRGGAAAGADPTGLIAHEWGTFTAVAGRDGLAADWLPLGGPADLPCFVERYKNLNPFKSINVTALTYEAARSNLWGKVRMETPVLYLYSAEDATVDVTVRFPRGLMTEWYPHAKVTQPDVTPKTLASSHTSVIEWRNVKVLPKAEASFPTEPGESHYYAARETDASPISVDGRQEKFLFYRGVAGFDVPVSAEALDNGSVRVKNLGSSDLRGVILFQNRGGRVSYRGHGTLRGEATLAEPVESASPAVVRAELERILTEAGLYAREARAMVATWRDAWFEEGTRVFYVLAPPSVDAILPLRVEPAPAQIARVFMGRMEVITPAALQAVQTAIDAHDVATLARHGRFLGAMTDRLLSRGATAAEKARIANATNAAFAAYVGRAQGCKRT